MSSATFILETGFAPSELDEDELYPSSDGKPMGESDPHRRWISNIIDIFERFFSNRDDVYVTGDLFWYPVEGKPKIVSAPDTMVVFGRPSHDRLCYKQWVEDNVVPQVTMEVRSQNNTREEMKRRRLFCQRHGVQEHYMYDPFRGELEVYRRSGDRLRKILPNKQGKWTSRLLGVFFWLEGEDLKIADLDGNLLQTSVEAAAEAESNADAGSIRKSRDLWCREAKRTAEAVKKNAEEVKKNAEEVKRNAEEVKRNAEEVKRNAEEVKREADEAKREAERLEKLLRDAGIDPEKP